MRPTVAHREGMAVGRGLRRDSIATRPLLLARLSTSKVLGLGEFRQQDADLNVARAARCREVSTRTGRLAALCAGTPWTRAPARERLREAATFSSGPPLFLRIETSRANDWCSTCGRARNRRRLLPCEPAQRPRILPPLKGRGHVVGPDGNQYAARFRGPTVRPTNIRKSRLLSVLHEPVEVRPAPRAHLTRAFYGATFVKDNIHGHVNSGRRNPNAGCSRKPRAPSDRPRGAAARPRTGGLSVTSLSAACRLVRPSARLAG